MESRQSAHNKIVVMFLALYLLTGSGIALAQAKAQATCEDEAEILRQVAIVRDEGNPQGPMIQFLAEILSSGQYRELELQPAHEESNAKQWVNSIYAASYLSPDEISANFLADCMKKHKGD